nr:ras-related protein Ral-B isoform X3 [Odocoileus virginianus texanus]
MRSVLGLTPPRHWGPILACLAVPGALRAEPLFRSGLYAADVSRKAQAGKKDAADVAAFPCAERQSRTACLRLRDAAFAGRRLGPQECAPEHPSPAAVLGSVFQRNRLSTNLPLLRAAGRAAFGLENSAKVKDNVNKDPLGFFLPGSAKLHLSWDTPGHLLHSAAFLLCPEVL